VAYFIYLVTQPVTFPLPLKLLEEYGEDWWKPDHIISNGAFRLLEFDAAHGLLERNPDYFGEFSGNLNQFRWKFSDGLAAVLRDYLGGQADYASGLTRDDVSAEVPASEFLNFQGLSTDGLNLNPDLPPLDDVRVRRAIAHAIDREELNQVYGSDLPLIHGGIVPPGMAGHSPELGLEFNLERARKLLAEAGYPNEKHLPILKYLYAENAPIRIRISEELKRQLFVHLGIQIELIPMSMAVPWWTVRDSHLQMGGWIADYPDPDNFLRQSTFYRVPRNRGWRHPRLDQLLGEAAHTTDRAHRLAMYREADRILVNEEAVVAPLGYSAGAYVDLLKPWVKGCKYNALGNNSLKDIVIEPH
jgi:oligopeptide transport system substrate-binding protein